MKNKQTGLTLIGFLVVVVVVGFFGYMAMRLVPSYIEFMGVKKAMGQMASEGMEGRSLDMIRADLMKKLDFQYVDDATVHPEDITLDNENNAAILHVDYDKQVPFLYNIDFLLHFDTSVQMRGDG